MYNLEIKTLENGNLELYLPDQDDRDEVRDMIADKRGYWYIMAELMEDYSCNGSYTHFDSSEANPFVGLTEAPCIAEEMDVLDDGTNEIVGNFWFFDRYVFDLEHEQLANGERVIYTLYKD